MQSTYDLKWIKSSSDKYLTKALSIYVQNIDPLIRTDTREIHFWLDRYNQKFTDKFFVVALLLNEEIVGYCQFVFFRDEKLVFIDYMAIEKQHRRNNTFYEFIEKIKEFLTQENIEYNYVITEVGYYKEKNVPTEVTRNLIRLLKMSGFGVIKTDYYQPMLGKENHETEIGTILMLFTSSEVKQIKKETFLIFIKTIYFKHYKRWYDNLLNDFEQAEYVKRLNELKEKIEILVQKKDVVEINGYSNLFTSHDVPTRPKKFVGLAKAIAVILSFFIVATLMGGIVIFVKQQFGIDQETLKFIAIISVIILAFIVMMVYKSKNEPFTDLIERIIKSFTK